MVVVASADALQVSRLMLDTPAHEGDERGRAKVQSGHGGDFRWADDYSGCARLGGQQANDARMAGALRSGRTGGPGESFASTDAG
jgi:hypothetical protein